MTHTTQFMSLENCLQPSDEPHKTIGLQRRQLAQQFLESVVLPILKKNIEITHAEFDRLMIQFQEENSGPGSDFEIGHVWGVAYEQVLVNENIAKTCPGEISPNAMLLKKAWDLVTQFELEE